MVHVTKFPTRAVPHPLLRFIFNKHESTLCMFVVMLKTRYTIVVISMSFCPLYSALLAGILLSYKKQEVGCMLWDDKGCITGVELPPYQYIQRYVVSTFPSNPPRLITDKNHLFSILIILTLYLIVYRCCMYFQHHRHYHIISGLKHG